MESGAIVNETGLELPESTILKCAEEVLKRYRDKPANYTIVFVDTDKIRALNKKYYKKDSVTDVLTFGEKEDNYLGEVVICPAYIKEKHSKDKFKWELCHMAVHGVFHLIGMHHEELSGGHEELHKKESEIINKIL